MNRKDRRTLKSIERRLRRAVDTLTFADPRRMPLARQVEPMRHANALHRLAVDKGLTTEPD